MYDALKDLLACIVVIYTDTDDSNDTVYTVDSCPNVST